MIGELQGGRRSVFSHWAFEPAELGLVDFLVGELMSGGNAPL